MDRAGKERRNAKVMLTIFSIILQPSRLFKAPRKDLPTRGQDRNQLRKNKCQLEHESLESLGYIISKEGRRQVMDI